MSRSINIWHLGARLMASVQARDNRSARQQLDRVLGAIASETVGQFSHFKLRTLQVLTNANRAAFSAGASTASLAEHSRCIIAELDKMDSKTRLVGFAQEAVAKTIGLVPKENMYHDRVVQDAVAYIRSHYSEGISRDQVARQLGCSVAHFSRVFSKTTGRSYKDFVLDCRIEKAKDLLQHSHSHIAEIARKIGYEDPFQFSKVFRKRVGVSPRRYRESRMTPGGNGGAQSTVSPILA